GQSRQVGSHAMRTRTRTSRRGFTLLEVLLASAIGLLILYSLYQAIDLHLRFAEAGRTVVEESTLARSVLSRISADIAPCVGLVDPSRYRGQQGSSTSSAQTTTDTTQQPQTGTI